MYIGNTFDNCYQEVHIVAEKEGCGADLFFSLGHSIGIKGNESAPVLVSGKNLFIKYIIFT